jgi:ketosteroid isomerase-like protein
VRVDDFSSWLTRYGDAWEARDAEALARLFAPGALFEAQPFATPLRGKPAIRAHWAERFVGQADPAFRAEVLGVGQTFGVAHWRTTYRPTSEPGTATAVDPATADHPTATADPATADPATADPATADPATGSATVGQTTGPAEVGPATVAIDGVLMAAFDPMGRCTSLRQWWHEGEPLPAL